MKSQRQWIMTILTLALLASGTVVSAQEKAPRPGPGPRITMGDGGHAAFIGSDSGFMMAEMASGKVVKGAPYSAQAVTESTQVLADGNRIVRKTTASIYRDGEGRTRHEQTLGGFGVQAESKQIIAINDPVGGAHIMLDPENKIAHKMTPPPGMFRRVPDGAGAGVHVQSSSATTSSDQTASVRHEGGHFNVQITKSDDADSSRKVESLGKQTFDGVEAEGTRITRTIAIGEIGNEQPINIVTERWYSPDLQVVVMMKNSDPRNGENTYKLVNINRAEPADSLFKVPSDYTVKEGGGKPGMRMEMRRKPASEQ